MRSHSSTKQSNRSMEGERPNNKLKEEPHLSGAYIRSLVKQLSSSRPKETPKSPDELSENLSKSLGESEQQPPPPPPPQQQQPKKQVRRRLHTSRPYQERLLNMAEARREIVTALKFHRAAMKQANEQQLQAQPTTPTLPPTQASLLLPLDDPHHEIIDSMKNPRVHPNTYTLPPSMHFNNPPFSPFTYPPPIPWSCPSIAPLPICDNLNLPLPNQPLGLNLNFQVFNNIDTSIYNSNNNKKPSAIQPSLSSTSSSCSSYSYSSPSPTTTMSGLETPSMLNEPLGTSDVAHDPVGIAVHPAMGDEEMAEIRSIGEQHDIEWNDTMNAVTSAWWCKFLKSMEVGQEDKVGGEGFSVFDEIMDIPVWLSGRAEGDGSDNCLLEQHMDDFHTEDYLQDASLPCWDIGEIEGLDGERYQTFLKRAFEGIGRTPLLQPEGHETKRLRCATQ